MNDPAKCMPTIGVSMKGPIPSIQDRFAFREVRGPLRRKKFNLKKMEILNIVMTTLVQIDGILS